ncbi:MAG: arylsulfatase [Pseudomonadota bacterium]
MIHHLSAHSKSALPPTKLIIFIAFFSPGFTLGQDVGETRVGERPNFVVIVADDMGWSDIGALGGEIRTPSLDELASRGTVMTDYYVAPTCAPTRSMLVTGVDNHQAGLGVQSGLRAANQVGINYEGQLHDGVVTVAEALSATGYQTFMSGKWHLSYDTAQEPQNRGFDRSFALIPGGASHFGDQLSIGPVEIARYIEDGNDIEALPDDWYSSTGYTDKIIEYLDSRNPDAPFFAYLTFTAPHDPLQVPDEWLDRYDGVYDDGPVATRQARADRQVELGLIAENTRLWPYARFPGWFPNHAKPWSDRSEKQREIDSRPMEVYASMIELMDQQIDRVVSYLKEQGELDNTYVIFFSDNGAGRTGPFIYPGVTKDWLLETWDQTWVEPGKPRSFTSLGREWASTAGTPWKMYKNTVAEGGIRSPLIISGPGVVPGEFNDALSHVTDITPTVYELAGIDTSSHPLFEGKTAPQGVSLMPVLSARADSVREMFGVHLFGNRGLRKGEWKISNVGPPQGSGVWQLFNLAEDPGEVQDLAAEMPAKLQELLADYDRYLAENDVILPDQSPLKASLRALYPGECNWWCETKFKMIAWMN